MEIQENDLQDITVTLTLDNDETLECSIVTIFKKAGKSYIVLLPLSDDGESEGQDVFLYRYHEENGEPVLENIEDDEEYEIAVDGFDEWMDTQEYDDLVAAGEEDEDE